MGLDHLLTQARRGRAELALDVVLGVSLWMWAAGLFLHESGPPMSIRVAIAATNGGVGLLFFARGRALAHGSTFALLAALPSIALGGIALRVSPPEWPMPCVIAFLLASVLAIAALLTLGRSFAILPARRSVVVRGPYRIVRHPAYAAELAMVVAAGCAHSWWAGLLLGALVALALVPRIRAEEALLASDEAFAEYSRAVRFRLVPLVW